MTAISDRAWVVVLGATGFTGRLVCRALRRRNIRFVIAGRSARKLALLSESLGGVETCVVDLGSTAELRALLDRRLLVCACAGPFVDVGHPAMAAAAEMGVHYVDMCREQAFAQAGVARYDAIARASGACIVPSMGFESAPADWAASLLADRLGGTLDALDIVYVVRAPGAALAESRGALRSAVATLARGGAAQHVGGALRPEYDASVVRRFQTLRDGEITAASIAGTEAVLTPAHLPVTQVRTFRATTPLAALAMQARAGWGPSWRAPGAGRSIDSCRTPRKGPTSSRAATRGSR